MIAALPSTTSPSTPAQRPPGPKGSYIIKLKDGKDGAEAKKLLEEIEKQGGEVEDDQSNSKFMPRITAVLPESYAASLNNTLQGGEHDVIQYMEPNGQVKVSPLPGNLPNPPKRD